MFPWFFISMLVPQWWDSIINPQNTTTQMNTKLIMVNRVNDDVIKALAGFIKVYEGFSTKAYNLKDNKITIGYGTTQWLNATGNVVRPVRLGDTITELVAEQQLKYYFVKIVPDLNQFLAINNITVPQMFLASLLNFTYMSGAGFLNWQSTRAMIMKVNRNENLSSVAFILKTDMVNAYKTLRASGTELTKSCGKLRGLKWDCYGLGWSRRIQASADLVEGKMKSETHYFNTIKKAF